MQHSVGQIQLGPDTDGTVMIAIAVSIAIAIIGQRNFGRQGADRVPTKWPQIPAEAGAARSKTCLSLTHSFSHSPKGLVMQQIDLGERRQLWGDEWLACEASAKDDPSTRSPTGRKYR